MVRELGESKPITIEELARRNPAAAEQLKQAAEASVSAKMQASLQVSESLSTHFTDLHGGGWMLNAYVIMYTSIRSRWLQVLLNRHRLERCS